MKRNTFLLFFILAVISVILACSSGSDADATAQAISDVFSKTATAAAASNESSENPLQTAQAEATEQAADIEVTLEAVSEADAEAQQATAAAEAPVIGELKLYGIDTEKGHVAWIHPPKNSRSRWLYGLRLRERLPGYHRQRFCNGIRYYLEYTIWIVGLWFHAALQW